MFWLFPLSVSFSKAMNTESDNSAKHSCELFNFSATAVTDMAFDFLTVLKFELFLSKLSYHVEHLVRFLFESV